LSSSGFSVPGASVVARPIGSMPFALLLMLLAASVTPTWRQVRHRCGAPPSRQPAQLITRFIGDASVGPESIEAPRTR
jgi:hypothetical protein